MVPHAGHWAIISLLKCPQRCMFKRWRSLLIAPSTIRILVLFELLFLIKRPKASGLAHSASWEGGTTYTSTSSTTSHSVMTRLNFHRSQSHLILMTVLWRRRYGNVDMLVVLMYHVSGPPSARLNDCLIVQSFPAPWSNASVKVADVTAADSQAGRIYGKPNGLFSWRIFQPQPFMNNIFIMHQTLYQLLYNRREIISSISLILALSK